MKVVGLSGTIGSGKNELKEIIKERFSCYFVTLSDVIRGELEKKKKTFNRMSLQDLGNEMRKKYGTHILSMLAVEYLPRDREVIIIDGIRNPGEGEYLKKKFAGNFVWLGVDAPIETRFQRASERHQHSDPKSLEEFSKLDERDQGAGEPDYGQQTKRCLEQCDSVIVNDGTLDEFKNKVNKVLDDLVA